MKKRNGVLTDVTYKDLELLEKNPNKFWNGVRTIGHDAFSAVNLYSIIIPSTVKYIGKHAFNSELKEVLIEGEPYISDYAFGKLKCLIFSSIFVKDAIISEDAFSRDAFLTEKCGTLILDCRLENNNTFRDLRYNFNSVISLADEEMVFACAKYYSRNIFTALMINQLERVDPSSPDAPRIYDKVERAMQERQREFDPKKYRGARRKEAEREGKMLAEELKCRRDAIDGRSKQ